MTNELNELFMVLPGLKGLPKQTLSQRKLPKKRRNVPSFVSWPGKSPVLHGAFASPAGHVTSCD